MFLESTGRKGWGRGGGWRHCGGYPHRGHLRRDPRPGLRHHHYGAGHQAAPEVSIQVTHIVLKIAFYH